MKKYLILSFVFLFISFPVIAKNANGNQAQNQNQIQTQNEGEEESEQLGEDVGQNMDKVSDQVRQLKLNFDDEGGIGTKVREIAQNQEQNQKNIKSTFYELKNRGRIVRLFVGSDKKRLQALGEMIEENQIIINDLMELKNQTNNENEESELQETINSMIAQNSSLQNELGKEKQVNGLFDWFLKLFNR